MCAYTRRKLPKTETWSLEKERHTVPCDCTHVQLLIWKLQTWSDCFFFSLLVANLSWFVLFPTPSSLSISLRPFSVSHQQVQAPTPQPTTSPPLVPATSQPAPTVTSHQVRLQRRQIKARFFILSFQTSSLIHIFYTTPLDVQDQQDKLQNSSTLFLCLYSNSCMSSFFKVTTPTLLALCLC